MTTPIDQVALRRVRGSERRPGPTAGPIDDERACGDGVLSVRQPTVADGIDIWRLAHATPVLDANSAYAYVLWCRDFAATSIVATVEGLGADGDAPGLAGFVTGFRRPAAPDTLFVWQVAVDERMRRRGIAARLLTELVERIRPHGVERVEATVAPSNVESQALFRTVAARVGAPCAYPTPGGFDVDDLADGHEAEPLLVIGPL
jgi:L-2,4-diaminobutyric acid acetyltransferase